ncbi:MAG: nitrilase-related carbon-nitrogen hydrolase [Gammaproteobacteria bacterium]
MKESPLDIATDAPMSPQPERYAALALQLATHCVNACPDRESARARMAENIARVRQKVAGSKAFIRQYSGEEARLVVLPEYFLTGFPMGDSVPAWRDKAALEIDGPEYEALGAIAADFDIYLAGNAYEADPHFPTLYFQCSFLLAPSGDVVLRYRRMISLSGPTPYDVWDRYLEIHGLEGVFPVADTPIGRIAAIASEEILYPEIARCHAMRGAEIFIHSTSEAGMPQDSIKEIARRARALENLAYVVSANSAALTDIPVPAESTTGMSKVVDYHGHVMAEAMPGGESMVANATIDLAALRATRRQTGLTNMLSRQPFQAYAQSYAQAEFRAPNGLLGESGVRLPERADFVAAQLSDIERLARKGLI